MTARPTPVLLEEALLLDAVGSDYRIDGGIEPSRDREDVVVRSTGSER